VSTQVRPFGCLGPWRTSSSRQNQTPKSAAPLITGQCSCSHAAMAASSRSVACRAGTLDLHYDPVQQQVQPRLCVADTERLPR
jgi:hypothetical protein